MDQDQEKAATTAPRRAGCPPVLEADPVDQDVGVPPTDWLSGPPTARRDRDPADVVDLTAPDVTDLTTTRATHLLDATIAHLQAAMEATESSAAHQQLDRAITEILRARDTLARLPAADESPVSP